MCFPTISYYFDLFPLFLQVFNLAIVLHLVSGGSLLGCCRTWQMIGNHWKVGNMWAFKLSLIMFNYFKLSFEFQKCQLLHIISGDSWLGCCRKLENWKARRKKWRILGNNWNNLQTHKFSNYSNYLKFFVGLVYVPPQENFSSQGCECVCVCLQWLDTQHVELHALPAKLYAPTCNCMQSQAAQHEGRYAQHAELYALPAIRRADRRLAHIYLYIYICVCLRAYIYRPIYVCTHISLYL